MTASSTSTFIDLALPPDAFPPVFRAEPVVRFEANAEERDQVERARKGDLAAFRELVESHQQSVFRFCRLWLESEEDAREACQDVFTRAHRALPRYRCKGRFSTWLYRIALNRCRDLRKTRAARFARLSDSLHLLGADPMCPCPRPDTAAIWNDDAEKLRRGLAGLPRRHREVLVLAHLEELPHLQCAQVLGCSERGLEGRLYRARQALRDWWESEPE